MVEYGKEERQELKLESGWSQRYHFALSDGKKCVWQPETKKQTTTDETDDRTTGIAKESTGSAMELTLNNHDTVAQLLGTTGEAVAVLRVREDVVVAGELDRVVCSGVVLGERLKRRRRGGKGMGMGGKGGDTGFWASMYGGSGGGLGVAGTVTGGM